MASFRLFRSPSVTSAAAAAAREAAARAVGSRTFTTAADAAATIRMQEGAGSSLASTKDLPSPSTSGRVGSSGADDAARPGARRGVVSSSGSRSSGGDAASAPFGFSPLGGIGGSPRGVSDAAASEEGADAARARRLLELRLGSARSWLGAGGGGRVGECGAGSPPATASAPPPATPSGGLPWGAGPPSLPAASSAFRPEIRPSFASSAAPEPAAAATAAGAPSASHPLPTPAADSLRDPLATPLPPPLSLQHPALSHYVYAAPEVDPGVLRDLLLDGHGRRHRYLRLSLTERCNLRCRRVRVGMGAIAY